ncbi:ATP-binding protein [Roseivirga sp. BDSF3-8]|uniref:ATP-binding protein n=1 Tax=Roseivirga sp. BDSF3-8 TaxID=3241598 RepID=UPI003531B53F
MGKSLIIFFAFFYLALLFAIAWLAERRAKSGHSLVNNPYIYSLSLAVYCTAWTFYGSVGRAASSGLEFITIYLGPTLMAPLWWLVMRKIIRICRVNRITTIADLISSRYGKNVTLGGIVTAVCVLGIIPYISLQLKAISSSYTMLTRGSLQSAGASQIPFYADTAFFIALILALFIIFFGTRHVDATYKREGMVAAIAFESVFKLIAFLIIGVFVSYVAFDGVQDIFTQAASQPRLSRLFTLDQNNTSWLYMTLLSMVAILFLPRQFQVSVLENQNERHLQKAMWLFPLYLLIINLFVLPIAFGGSLLFQGRNVDADMYVLAIPMEMNQGSLALMTFLGGFAAATSMIIVSTIALSIMLTNNLIMPILVGMPYLKNYFREHLSFITVWSRRVNIIIVLLCAYAYYRGVADYFPLVSIGLISFAAVMQFMPAIIGGIYWKAGTKLGALTGILLGFGIWFYTLIIPTIVRARLLPQSIMSDGLFGIHSLKPYALFGLQYLDPISHCLFWSMLLNIGAYIYLSVYSTQSSKERNQAELFVDIFKYSANTESSVVWKGTAYTHDLRSLLHSFLGKGQTDKALATFSKRHTINMEAGTMADHRLVNYAEKLLAGAIGAAASRIMVASVVKEEEITMDEVYNILKESQQLMAVNKELIHKSKELKIATEKLQAANHRLKELDHLKDEFISTVTHEMRTPITSIRAFSEILHDTPDLGDREKDEFISTIIKETQRMERLINQVLDLERFDSGRQKLSLEPLDLNSLIHEAISSLNQVAREAGATVQTQLQANLPLVEADKDRITQVVLNLLSNALKFCPPDTGRVVVASYYRQGSIHVSVTDNGSGIDPESLPLLFDKFFQAKNQTTKKPKGSGLGLAISRKIIEHHEGQIWARSEIGKGSVFTFALPVVRERNKIAIE